MYRTQTCRYMTNPWFRSREINIKMKIPYRGPRGTQGTLHVRTGACRPDAWTRGPCCRRWPEVGAPCARPRGCGRSPASRRWGLGQSVAADVTPSGSARQGAAPLQPVNDVIIKKCAHVIIIITDLHALAWHNTKIMNLIWLRYLHNNKPVTCAHLVVKGKH